MGRRKVRKAPPKKAKSVVPNVFDCPFCNASSSVECKMDRKSSTGKVLCRICGTNYQTSISYLTDAVDVFSEWIDECQKENEREHPEEYEEEYEEEDYTKKRKKIIQQKKHQEEEEEEEEDYEEEEGVNSDDDPDLFLKKHSVDNY
eukprot:gene5437-9250_t